MDFSYSSFRQTSVMLIRAFFKGAFDRGVLQMVVIFVLAGAFAGIARGIGSVDATVAATLRLMPGSMIYAGLFLTACVISFSVGTSVGTIAAVVPIACGVAADTGISVPFITGIVVGGAFFGDNLSFISDTTLAATKALKVRMKDKFKANVHVVLPAVVMSLLIYAYAGLSSDIVIPELEDPQPLKLIPYLIVILLALCGVGVNVILITGIAACIIAGTFTGVSDWMIVLESVWTGVRGMTEVIIVALIAGGLLSVVKALGWFNAFTAWMKGIVHTKRGAMASIASLVSVTNLMTANNTVAILSVGGVANDIADTYHLDHKKVAGILDVFSCLVQSIIPYGAQLLMASAFAGVSAVSIIPWLFYPFLMGVCAIISILKIRDAR